MKRTVAVLLIAILLTPILAFAAQLDISAIPDDELLTLHAEITSALRDRGIYPYIELKSGASGDEVTRLQRRLAELGYYTKDPTGKFDKNTTTAFKAFQKASGIKQSNTASVANQQLLFSAQAVSKPTPTPKPTKKPTPTPDPRKAYGKFNFNTAARTPEEYKGTKVKIVGRVLQVLGDRNSGFEMRVATKGRYDNVIYIATKGGHPENILEGDKLTFYCVMKGDYTYESIMSQSITLPLALADFYQ
jgi:peptidoglycan hydrolase-like protein with peptidoglycan-binding domain